MGHPEAGGAGERAPVRERQSDARPHQAAPTSHSSRGRPSQSPSLSGGQRHLSKTTATSRNVRNNADLRTDRSRRVKEWRKKAPKNSKVSGFVSPTTKPRVAIVRIERYRGTARVRSTTAPADGGFPGTADKRC